MAEQTTETKPKEKKQGKAIQSDLPGTTTPKTKGQLRAEEYLAACDDYHDAGERVKSRKEALVSQMKADKAHQVKAKDSTGDIHVFDLYEVDKLVHTK